VRSPVSSTRRKPPLPVDILDRTSSLIHAKRPSSSRCRHLDGHTDLVGRSIAPIALPTRPVRSIRQIPVRRHLDGDAGVFVRSVSSPEDRDVMGAFQKNSGGNQARVLPVISTYLGPPVAILRRHDDLYRWRPAGVCAPAYIIADCSCVAYAECDSVRDLAARWRPW
jgi:hypothetical protein